MLQVSHGNPVIQSLYQMQFRGANDVAAIDAALDRSHAGLGFVPETFFGDVLSLGKRSFDQIRRMISLITDGVLRHSLLVGQRTRIAVAIRRYLFPCRFKSAHWLRFIPAEPSSGSGFDR